MGPGLASVLFKEKGCSLVWTTPAGVAGHGPGNGNAEVLHLVVDHGTGATLHLLANVAYRHRSSFLRCKQGKRSLQDYVMELHNLEAAMAGAPLSEDVKVTVFIDGVRMGPVQTELFRRQPNTFNEAVHIAMLEDHCVRSAQGHTPHVEASEGPTP
ncbi:hypothetical protein PR003_g23511 [Phytophthora rubi]|uniref:Retrotransposon gag domain-containing protein n=2 Tax=Phytophthora rubi TaxID=129364 RepID=A0A6A4D6D3_9STRA|nr:hypothetical protein PR001_g22458 [Phytophthora rubi]KAE9297383.1 hypothetical protein PR003_g23511 [Phytophthora rubi]